MHYSILFRHSGINKKSLHPLHILDLVDDGMPFCAMQDYKIIKDLRLVIRVTSAPKQTVEGSLVWW